MIESMKLRTRLCGVSRLGTLCGALAMLVLVTGCLPVVSPPPTTTCDADADCDDGLFCNGTETCDVASGDCVDGTAPCTPPEVCNDTADRCEECGNEGQADCDDGDACTTDACTDGACVFTPVECGDQFCNPADGTCVDCLEDADCDDGVFCNGAETCGADNTCAAGMEPCDAATEVCLEDTDECVAIECTDDVDCDDGLFCTGVETCVDQLCVDGTNPCADPTPVCDEANAVCVECLEDADCPEGETCVGNVCTAAPPCTIDEDCDDANVCTDDSCGEDGFCVFAAIEGCCLADADCAEGEVCNLDTNTCQPMGNEFDLTTDDDAITGTAGDDIFRASIGTLNPADIVVGNGGNDVMNATVAGATSSEATLIDIDEVNFTTLNATTFNAMNTAAIGEFAVAAGSSGNLTLTNLEEDTALRMGTGYTRRLTATLANDVGAADEMDLTIEGTAAGARFDYVQTAAGETLETLNLIVLGSTLSPADAGADLFGDVDEVLVTGMGDLVLSGVDPTDLAANAPDTSDFEGTLTIEPAADAGPTFDFTAGGLAAIEGIDNYVITDTMTFNHVITLNTGDSPFNVDISNIDEDDLAGDVTVTQSGAGTGDTINLTLGGDGDGMGAFAAASTEFLNIDSGGTTPNEIGDVTIAAGVAFVTTTVTVTGDQDLDLGVVVGDGVNAAAFDGDLTVDNTGDGGQNQIVGGNGDDLLIPGNGVDQATGGPGIDTFGFDTIVANANRNLILDFLAGDGGDILRFDQATFAEYDGSAIDIVDAGSVTDTANEDNEVVVDTAANILAIDTSGGNGSNPIAIASDTGDIYFDADGNYANAVVIGNIDADQVDDLVPDNFDFP